MKARLILLAMILAVCSLGSPGVSRAEEPRVRVKLEVIGDQSVDTEAQNHLKKSLEGLSHIQMVEEDPQVYMHVIARRIVTNTGRRIGYVMASASAEILELGLNDGTPFTCSDYNGLWLETGPDLRALCEKCVMAVDYGVFSKVRKLLVGKTEPEGK